MACAFGANIPCDAKADIGRAPDTATRNFYHENLGSDFSNGDYRARYGGHLALPGKQPDRRFCRQVDAQGHEAAYWTRVTP
jgi:hypothetical protein